MDGWSLHCHRLAQHTKKHLRTYFLCSIRFQSTLKPLEILIPVKKIRIKRIFEGQQEIGLFTHLTLLLKTAATFTRIRCILGHEEYGDFKQMEWRKTKIERTLLHMIPIYDMSPTHIFHSFFMKGKNLIYIIAPIFCLCTT